MTDNCTQFNTNYLYRRTTYTYKITKWTNILFYGERKRDCDIENVGSVQPERFLLFFPFSPTDCASSQDVFLFAIYKRRMRSSGSHKNNISNMNPFSVRASSNIYVFVAQTVQYIITTLLCISAKKSARRVFITQF